MDALWSVRLYLSDHRTMTSQQTIFQAEPFTSIRTLGQAIRILHSVRQPILRYRQQISLLSPDHDLTYSGHIRHDRENHLVTISFPSELKGVVTRIQNSHGCRMVSYYKDPITEFIEEIQIHSKTELNCLQTYYPPVIRIYTRGIEDLVVSFDVYLFKSSVLRSAL